MTKEVKLLKRVNFFHLSLHITIWFTSTLTLCPEPWGMIGAEEKMRGQVREKVWKWLNLHLKFPHFKDKARVGILFKVCPLFYFFPKVPNGALSFIMQNMAENFFFFFFDIGKN